MRRSALLLVSVLLGASPALARDGRSVSLPRDQAAAAVLQLSPGSGVSPGYDRPRLVRAGRPGRVVFEGNVPVGVVDRDGTVLPLGSFEEDRPVRRGFGSLGGPETTRPAYRPVRPSEQAVSPRRQVSATAPMRSAAPRAIDPRFLPQTVRYQTSQPAGTIVIDTRQRFLYRVEAGGTARRYGVGVGKEGFGWSGTQRISRKAQWPGWTPPAEMIARERAKGRVLPAYMEGGEANPLGARALYLGSTLYRIHGTNQPWTIGQAVSSGCIRMRNEDVIELYDSVPVGARVVVL